MDNPFVVDRPVAGDELCGREPILERLLAAARRDEPAALAATRGAGVTSLARELARRLASEGQRPVLVDAADRQGAAELLAEAVAATGAGADREDRETNAGPAEARDVADLAEDLAARGTDRPIHLVLDGLGRRGGVDGLEELAAIATEGEVGVTALWQGSPEDPEGKLAPAGAAPGPVPTAAWMPYVLERFLRTDRWIANEHVREAVDATGGRPLHAQLLFHLAWEEAGPDGRVDGSVLERARRRLLRRAGRRFRLLLDPLTRNQRRLLEALARAEGPVRPYASGFVRRHGFASPSSVQRALNALRDGGLVDETDEAGPRPSDPVLARWLRRPRAERVSGG